MFRSSLGFHTLTLILILTEKEARQLMEHFKKYSEVTGLIKIFPIDGKGLTIKYETSGDGTQKTILKKNKNFRVTYHKGEDRGIEWLIRYNNWNSEFKSYIVEVTINPKILGGIHDYVTAAKYDDMETAITNFNLEAKRISPILRDFKWYSLKRIDYCINFYLEELEIMCSPEMVMELIRRADIPSYYKEWMEYCDTSHRMKSNPDSFYLMNPSANIQFYSKYMEMKKRSEDRESKGLSPIPQIILDAARNLIRFEVQYKYRKLYTQSLKANYAGNLKTNKYESLLSDDACNDAISYYFNKVIGKGDWYTLYDAIRKIEVCNFNKQKECRLIEALQLVNKCRSVATAKASYQGRDLEAFKSTLKELSCLGINPVTIPKEWGARRIPNLLYSYYDKVQEEKNDRHMRELDSQNFKEYVEEFGYPF